MNRDINFDESEAKISSAEPSDKSDLEEAEISASLPGKWLRRTYRQVIDRDSDSDGDLTLPEVGNITKSVDVPSSSEKGGEDRNGTAVGSDSGSHNDPEGMTALNLTRGAGISDTTSRNNNILTETSPSRMSLPPQDPP